PHMSNVKIILKSGRDKPVRQHHPRLFSGGIKAIDGRPKSGEVVEIFDNHGEWVARGVINEASQIAIRLLTWNVNEAIDEAFWQRRVAQAVARRKIDPLLRDTNARRIIFGESDGLPGVIADDYAGHIVLEYSALVALNARDTIESAIQSACAPAQIHIRYDDERLKGEGVSAKLFGPSAPALVAPPKNATLPIEAAVIIREGTLQFRVDLTRGQKTGFYLDQRQNRQRVAAYCTGGRVLNTFSYTGGFAIYAATAGATEIINVDSSADALRLAHENALLNELGLKDYGLGINDNPQSIMTNIQANVFDDLRVRREAGELYDVVVLDPPKFAHNPSQIERAARAYKDLNRVGMHLVKPGGVLATFSCSGVVDASLFQKIIFSAAMEAEREVHIVEHLSQASDHPVLLTFPESEYLKGLICRVY
ncbi:MAG: class I SAM-dependent rRNA methyltransferase, partial [Chloroflexi bacterium]|nr:class I SAM-dependent rRNA methyltransferase [Chloroflexota bacterium]